MPTFAKYIIYFLIYSTLGALLETGFRLVTEQHWYGIHGFLHLPLFPIYGFGALLILLIARYIRNPIILFFVGGVAVSILEFAAHWLIEVIFNDRIWSYENGTPTLGGRISLLSSFWFSVAAVVLVYIIHPRVVKLIDRIPSREVMVIVVLAGTIVLFDIIFSIIERLIH